MGKLATFVPNKKMPVYNWFYYKEGFSREIVLELVKMFKLRKGDNVLDPFCGCGTTNLACKEMGINSYGFDVLPLCVLASQVKTMDYDLEGLKKAIKDLKKLSFEHQDLGRIPGNVRRFFSPHTLQDVLFFREKIKGFQRPVRDFLFLGLISAATKCSWMYKDGAVIKIKKKSTPQFRKFYLRVLKKMLTDLKRLETNPCKTEIDLGDARNLNIGDNTIDAVITSPPYLNKIEYTRVYGIEESLFFGEGKPGLRSYIGSDSGTRPVFPDINLPPAADAYLTDMKKVLEELHRVCKTGAKIGVVIGDGCFPAGVVHMDELLPKLAEKSGLNTERVYILNRRWCTRKRTEKIGQMEESLIVMTKR